MLPSPEFSGHQEIDAALAAVQYLTMCETASHGVKGSWNRGKGKERYSRLSPLASIDLPGCTPHLPKSDPHSCHVPHSLFFLEWNMSKESQQSSSGSRSPQSASMPEIKKLRKAFKEDQTEPFHSWGLLRMAVALCSPPCCTAASCNLVAASWP